MLNSKGWGTFFLMAGFVAGQAGSPLIGILLASLGVLIYIRRAWTLPEDHESPVGILVGGLALSVLFAAWAGWGFALFAAALGLTGLLALYRQKYRKSG